MSLYQYLNRANEAELLALCQSGDRAAWNTLIQRSEKTLYRFAFSLCRNSQEADDIVGEVFVSLYQNLSTFRNEASFTTWLCRIVRNTYFDLYVRPMHRMHLSLDTEPRNKGALWADRDLVDPTPLPETVCMQNETTQVLSKAIQNLPTYQRQMLHMHYIEGDSYQEIAETTGLSIGTVKSRLHRARRMLGGRLTEWNAGT